MVTCDIKLFRNYSSLRQRPTKIIVLQRVGTCLKIFQNYFRSFLHLMNIFQHVQCRWNNFEIVSAAKIISAFHFTRNHLQWLHMKYDTEIISKLLQNNIISHLTMVLHVSYGTFHQTGVYLQPLIFDLGAIRQIDEKVGSFLARTAMLAIYLHSRGIDYNGETY